MSKTFAVETLNLTKTYKVYGRPVDRIAEALSRGRKCLHTPVHALKGITATIPRGSALGVIGSNGAGKSTFLKILSGTSMPTSGSFTLNGRVASLLELGTGFHNDFTGRQNIHLNGSIMGMTRREIRERIDSIIDFSELQEFIDSPIRTYSAGMTMRLGFSVATAIDPDVLILDEIMAVGDMHFQKKCIDRIFNFRKAGKSILFCSHSLYDVRQICDEVIWIRDGVAEMRGDPLDVTHAYANYERSRIVSHSAVQEGVESVLQEAKHSNGPKIHKVSTLDPTTGEKVSEVLMKGSLELACEYEVPKNCPRFHVGFAWYRSDRIAVATTTTLISKVEVPHGEPGRFQAKVHVPSVDLIQGEYYIQAYIVDESGEKLHDHWMSQAPLVVVQRSRDVGLFLIDHDWKIDESKSPVIREH